MIVVTDIKTKIINGYAYNIYHLPDKRYELAPYGKKDVLEEPVINTEYIEGKVFRNKYGEKVCIGITEEAQKAIGLPFEVFENMETEYLKIEKELIVQNRKNKQLTAILNTCEKELHKYKKMNFWNRLKWIIKGKYER